MSEDKKMGLFSKLFGAKKSSCCGIRIEEVSEEQQNEETNEAREQSSPQDNKTPSDGSCCCGG